MKYLLNFLQQQPTDSFFAPYLLVPEEIGVLQRVLEAFLEDKELQVHAFLKERHADEQTAYFQTLTTISELIQKGWLVDSNNFEHESDSLFLLLHTRLNPSNSFLSILEEKPKESQNIESYSSEHDYLQEQFARLDLFEKYMNAKRYVHPKSYFLAHLLRNLQQLETTIKKRLEASEESFVIDDIFDELSQHEQMLFLYTLKAEFEHKSVVSLSDAIELISTTTQERIENKTLLEEGSTLIDRKILDYDEEYGAFDTIKRVFFIYDDVLQTLSQQNTPRKPSKLKLTELIKKQELFELIEPSTSLEDVVLNDTTKERLETLLKQLDKRVASRLKQWGIQEKKRGIDAKIIFYGLAGTGKTMTALSFAKSIKKPLISLDCSKILSMYVGESEKNVKKIFETYRYLVKESKTSPILLLNEADQFLSTRSTNVGSVDKMHNQMQNIFLEEIENFEGILIATTNLLDNIDKAFSRRFNYKIEFPRPTKSQRLELWQKMLPKNATFTPDFDSQKLSEFNLSGGQIHIVVKNVAYKVATREEPIFSTQDFIDEIKQETNATFELDKEMGFLK